MQARLRVSLGVSSGSSVVEAALADDYRFAGGPVPDKGLVLGTRTVRLGGPKVRRPRKNC